MHDLSIYLYKFYYLDICSFIWNGPYVNCPMTTLMYGTFHLKQAVCASRRSLEFYIKPLAVSNVAVSLYTVRLVEKRDIAYTPQTLNFARCKSPSVDFIISHT